MTITVSDKPFDSSVGLPVNLRKRLKLGGAWVKWWAMIYYLLREPIAEDKSWFDTWAVPLILAFCAGVITCWAILSFWIMPKFY